MAIALLGAVAVIGLVFIMPIAGIRDASRHSAAAWSAAGMSKKTWVGAMACGPIFFIPFVSLIGIAASGMYFAGRRKRLLAASRHATAGPALGGGFSR